MKKIIITLFTLLLSAGLLLSWMPSALAVDVFEPCQPGSNVSSSDVCKGGNFLGTWQNIINIITFFIGAVAVIMILIAGFTYVTSGGNPAAVNAAKLTIIYAIVGIIVSVSVYSIVNFALGIAR